MNFNLLWISLRIIKCFEMLFQTIERVFHQMSNPFESGLRKLGCTSFLQPTSQCFDIWWNSLLCVWYNLLEILDKNGTLNTLGVNLAPVVQRMDSTTHWINHYPLGNSTSLSITHYQWIAALWTLKNYNLDYSL